MLATSSTVTPALKERLFRAFAPALRPRALSSWGAGALLRPLVAMFVLLSILGSNVEAVEGMLRDGEVHHEPGALAAAHSGAGGEHGHEDGPLSDHSKHGGGHQHGTGADHCTHQHGTALPLSQTPAPQVPAEIAPLPDATGRPAWISTTLFHPPRA